MNTSTTNHQKTIMFYDGACPLCSREVAHYRRIDTNNNVSWLDISAHPESLEQHGIGYTAAMKHLHVLNSKGEMLRGAYAFQALWQALPRYRLLAHLVSFPGFLYMMDKVYNQFAKKRFAKRIACAR
jgi:predicted DCC family thiol-disulfide oxidoreductase YuxK